MEISAVNPDEGQILNIAGGTYRVIISGRQTNALFAVIEMTVPPGAGPIPHSHAEIDESFFVLEGEVTFQSDQGTYVATQNAFVNIPKGGLVHRFKNLSDRPAKLLCTVMPAGLEDFFAEAANAMADPDKRENLASEVRQISEKYGQKLYPEDYFSSK